MLWRRLDLDGSGEATLCGFGVLSGWCLETAVRLDCYIYIYNGHLYLLINYWKIMENHLLYVEHPWKVVGHID